MSRPLLFGLLALSVTLLLISSNAPAQDSPRRVLASCMMKRMTADRSVSYNEAQRMCKDEGKGSDAKPQTAANTQTKAVS